MSSLSRIGVAVVLIAALLPLPSAAFLVAPLSLAVWALAPFIVFVATVRDRSFGAVQPLVLRALAGSRAPPVVTSR